MIIFHEEQRFTQRWLWVMLIVTMLVLVSVFGWGMIEQLVLGKPWGDRPVSDTSLIIISSSILLFCGVMIYLFYSLRLITEVSDKALTIRFHPVHHKQIPYNEIVTVQARKYRPLYEYGGWGIKYGRSGWAYNIIGDKGVQLELANGKRILIGSQKAEELEHAIKSKCSYL